MKNTVIKSVLSLLLVFGTVGCNKELEELYQDPDGFSKTQADKAGVSIISRLFYLAIDPRLFAQGLTMELRTIN